VVVPNRISRGYHTFTATALDDVGNAASANITINLNADPGPLGIEWQSPSSFAFIPGGSFPIQIRFRIEDIKSVRRLRVFAKRSDLQGKEYQIGTIDDPALPGMSMEWRDAPDETGQYALTVRAELMSGDTKEESLTVQVGR
jgi:hypothetical protein